MNWRDIVGPLVAIAFFGWLVLFWILAGYGLWHFINWALF